MATVGLKDLYYAKLTSDDSAGTVYDPPQKLAPAIGATITPATSSGTLYADDGPAETNSSLGPTEVSLNTSDLPLDVQADLLGNTLNANGELVKSSEDKAPYVAIMFRSLRSDDAYQYEKLLKGRFREPESTNNTKGESVEYSTPTIVSTFVRRDYDKQWRRSAVEGQNGFTGGSTWFDSVE
jgi:phi13 family phage major tail protein